MFISVFTKTSKRRKGSPYVIRSRNRSGSQPLSTTVILLSLFPRFIRSSDLLVTTSGTSQCDSLLYDPLSHTTMYYPNLSLVSRTRTRIVHLLTMTRRPVSDAASNPLYKNWTILKQPSFKTLNIIRLFFSISVYLYFGKLEVTIYSFTFNVFSILW